MRSKKHYEKEIIEVIKKHNLFTIEMIFSFYSGISRANFYKLGLNKLDTIKKEVDDNKNRTKQSMLKKWIDGDNATLQMGAMKLIGTDEEVHRLNGTKVENQNINRNFNTDIDIDKLSKDDKRKILEILEQNGLIDDDD